MAVEQEITETFNQQDHQVAYIFDPDDEDRQQRPAKKRRVTKQTRPAVSNEAKNTSAFVPLLGGKEKLEFVALREQLYEEAWAKIDARIQNALRESNSAILDDVASFVGEAQVQSGDRIPSTFIITGTNVASQNLLFEQLSESLQRSSRSKFVRLRSSEAVTLKATLKKVIRDVTHRSSGADGEDIQITNGQKGYLDYDLEALHAFIQPQQCEHVFLAFEDSEGFDSGLLSQLIPLLNSWRPRIPFTLLFGIATSVELLQARLLKSVCQQIYGAQFDAVQTGSIFETIFKIAVAAADVPVRIGGSLLRSMLDRQYDQVAGVQAFISSLKYAYMCHFYANALSSILETEERGLARFQPEHVDAIRNSESYRFSIETSISRYLEEGRKDQSPEFIFGQAEEAIFAIPRPGFVNRRNWESCALRALLVLEAAGALNGDFCTAYADLMSGGIFVSNESTLVDRVRRMDDKTLMDFLVRAVSIYRDGDESLYLEPTEEATQTPLHDGLHELSNQLASLQGKAKEQGLTLRSKYSGQNKIVRTTVIAQRVQLSKDSAALSEEDKQYTQIIDNVTKLLVANLGVAPPREVALSEAWIYDSRSPSRDVFVPRPRVVFERSLTRPHDYLACECCGGKDGGGDGGGQVTTTAATLPATAILYHLYLETGNLINVADLWTAFQGIIIGSSQDKKDGDESESDPESNERRVLVLFYRALAELRALGFLKASKKKADHIAKLKWL